MTDDIDPACRSVLEAMEHAAKPSDRELPRLRKVDRLARELMLARPEHRERILEDLADALWPQEEQG